MIDGLNNFTFIIPARKGSKGFPHKNRSLIDFTIESIPPVLREKILITTDDNQIIKRFSDLKVVKRSTKNSDDMASMKDVLREIKPNIETTNIVLLYLTYPERTFNDITSTIKFFINKNAKSLLCKKPLNTSPFLMMFDHGLYGSQIIKHNLYRRQDYQKCFEISHFVAIMRLSEIENLNNNLYNEETVFYPIKNVIDVDLREDLQKYVKNKNNS